MPVTSGTATVTSGRPLETSRPTGEPATASCPASGSCASTSPAGAVRSYWDALADANPASWSVPFASASVIPVTSGTFAVAGPDDSVRPTAEPSSTSSPAAGSWRTTVPGSASGSVASPTSPTLSPASSSACVASASVLPVTSGTVTPLPRVTTIAATHPDGDGSDAEDDDQLVATRHPAHARPSLGASGRSAALRTAAEVADRDRQVDGDEQVDEDAELRATAARGAPPAM